MVEGVPGLAPGREGARWEGARRRAFRLATDSSLASPSPRGRGGSEAGRPRPGAGTARARFNGEEGPKLRRLSEPPSACGGPLPVRGPTLPWFLAARLLDYE